MAFSRSLLLKGLAGAAAVAGGGVGIAYREDIGNLLKGNGKAREAVNDKTEALVSKGDCKGEDSADPKCSIEGEGNKGDGEKVKDVNDKSEASISEEKCKQDPTCSLYEGKGDWEARKKVNDKLGTLGLEGDCLLDDSADPSSFSRECPIDEEKLKKIQFSNKGKEDLKVSGVVPSDLKLKIEGNKEDFSFSFLNIPSSPMEIFGDKSKGKIILKNDKKFTVQDGRLTKENRSQEIERLNEQLVTINAPIECRFDEAETEESFECPITQKALKEMKFSNKKGREDHRIDGSIPAGLKLKIERDEQNEMSFSFTGLEQNLTIYGYQNDGKIVVRGSETKFKVGEERRLEKVSTTADSTLKPKLKEFNKQLGTINAPLECRFDEAESEESFECPITQDQLKRIGFTIKGDWDLEEVEGWPSTSETIKLKVERDSGNEMSLSFPDITSESKIKLHGKRGKIILKSSETKFRVIDGLLTNVTADADLQKFNRQLEAVNAPSECRFNELESDTSVECDVSEEQLTEMQFSLSAWEQTLSEKNLSGMKLKVQSNVVIDGARENEERKVLTLTFKDYNKTFNLLDEDDDEIVSFVKGTNPEFGIYTPSYEYGKKYKEAEDENNNLVLLKKWVSSTFEGLLGLDCSIDDKEPKGECTFAGNEKKIKVGRGSGDDFEELTVADENSKFELHWDEEDYNQGYKFVFKGETVSGTGGSPSLVDNGNYELKWKVREGEPRTFYLAKKG